MIIASDTISLNLNNVFTKLENRQAILEKTQLNIASNSG